MIRRPPGAPWPKQKCILYRVAVVEPVSNTHLGFRWFPTFKEAMRYRDAENSSGNSPIMEQFNVGRSKVDLCYSLNQVAAHADNG